MIANRQRGEETRERRRFSQRMPFVVNSENAPEAMQINSHHVQDRMLCTHPGAHPIRQSHSRRAVFVNPHRRDNNPLTFSKQGLTSASPLLHGKSLLSYTAPAPYKTR